MPLSPRHAEIIATTWRSSYVLAPGPADGSRPWCVLAIPKNACRELKRVALGAAGHETAGMWDAGLHDLAEREVQLARLPETERIERLMSAPFLAVLRDPLERLASAFVDKLVSKTRPSTDAPIYTRYHGPHVPLEQAADLGVSFEQFCAAVCDTPTADLDMHFKPQANFLGEVTPDLTIALPDLRGGLERFAARFGLSIDLPDARRPSANRGWTGETLSRVTSGELRARGLRPPAVALLTPELRQRLAARFTDDLVLLGRGSTRADSSDMDAA